MSIRAPKRGPKPKYTDEEHTIEGHWEPSKLFRVLRPNGSLWAETSNEDEANTEAFAIDGTLQRRYDFHPAVCQWRDEEIS